MNAPIRLVMTLLVRNELDLLEHHIQYHQQQGVDFFIVTDNGSTDGSREIMEGYRKQGIMHVIDEAEDTFNQSEWVTRMTRYAYENCAADWIIHSDADEFWVPTKGTLKSTFSHMASTENQIVVERKNFLPSSSPKNPFWQQMIYRDVTSFNSSGYPLAGKVAHRPHPDVIVGMGNHTLRNGFPGEPTKVESITIFHFPYVSYEKFADKISLGGAALQRNTGLPPQAGYTWRELFALYEKGQLKQWYDALPKIETYAESGMAESKIVVDTRLRDFMQAVSRGELQASGATNS